MQMAWVQITWLKCKEMYSVECGFIMKKVIWHAPRFWVFFEVFLSYNWFSWTATLIKSGCTWTSWTNLGLGTLIDAPDHNARKKWRTRMTGKHVTRDHACADTVSKIWKCGSQIAIFLLATSCRSWPKWYWPWILVISTTQYVLQR